MPILRIIFSLFLTALSLNAAAEYGATINSLNRYSAYNIKRDCSANTVLEYCPALLEKLVADDDKSRALVLESRAPICRKAKEYLETSNSTASIRATPKLQEIMQKDRFAYLGEYSHGTIRTCAATSSARQSEIISKFYYYNSRLNAGATKIAQDRIIIAQLLGKQTPKCPDVGILDAANKSCQSLKACPPKQSLDQLTLDVTRDESLADEIKEKLNNLPKHCEQVEKCQKTKIALNGMMMGLQARNPWFLDGDFNKSKSKQTIQSRLSSFLERTEKNLSELQKRVSTTAGCIHGAKNCKIDEMRELLALMPEQSDFMSKDTEANYVNAQISTQACIEEGALDRNKTGSVLNDTYLQAGVTIATLGVGVLFSGAKLAGTAATARWAQAAVEIPNLSLDAYNAFLMGKEVRDACFSSEKTYQFQTLTKEDSCKFSGGSLSPANQAQGSCLISAGLGSVAALAFVPGGIRAAKFYQELKSANSTQNLTTLPSVAKETQPSVRQSDRPQGSAASSGTLPSGHLLKLDEVSKSPLKSRAIANTPENIRLFEGLNSEGSRVRYFQVNEKLKDGTWVKSTREFQLDSLTGAIDANYPAGRELFERIAKSKAGKAHFAFFDVGSLGAVNKTFVGGSQSGDRYIQAVAEKILKHGEGKITLARTGGDEFAVIIDEADPQKVQQLLAKIRDDLRLDHKGDGKMVFREEKIARANDYKANPTPENLERIRELAKIQQPDISIGSSQIGADDGIESLLKTSEEQAKQMKIQTTLEFARSAEKYGSKEIPRNHPNTMFRAEVKAPATSASWSKRPTREDPIVLSNLRDLKIQRIEELKRVGSSFVAKYEDELGRESFRLERYHTNPKSGKRELVTYEIPTRGQTGLLDGSHPESQKLILEHFQTNPDGVLVMPKLSSLRYLNYFESGTKAGDEMLEAVAQAVKKQTRESDLCFKLSGADFIMSMDKAGPRDLARIQERINNEILKSDGVRAVLDRERGLLTQKLTQAKRAGDLDGVARLTTKLEELNHFKPKIEFQNIKRSEVKKSSSFEDIYNQFNSKFANAQK